MPQGLQVFDANGQIVLDVTDRLTKILGTLTTTTSDGSLAIPAPGWGTVWIQMSAVSGEDFLAVPRVYYQGGAIYWTFSGASGVAPPASFRRPVQLIYGVY